MLDKKKYQNLLTILFGSFILAFGLYNFNYQNNITEGGILGLLLIFKNLFNLSPAWVNLVLDISLFLLGLKYFGKTFLKYSLVATCSFSIFYGILEQFNPIIPKFSNNLLLASILSGLFVGIGVGLVIKGGGAAGGDDVLALLLSNLTHFKLSHIYIIADISVLLLSLTYLDVKQIILSLVAVFISGKVIGFIYEHSNSPLQSNNFSL